LGGRLLFYDNSGNPLVVEVAIYNEAFILLYRGKRAMAREVLYILSTSDFELFIRIINLGKQKT
jgi:hypothetical protein